MLKWFWQLFVVGFPEDNCEHKWSIIEEITISRQDTPSGKVYVQQCEKCGKINEYRVLAD